MASVLTRLSEDAWDAAAFLDTFPALELAVSALVQQLRSPEDEIKAPGLPADGFRHAEQWSFADATELLSTDALAVLTALTRAAAHDRRRAHRRRLRAR